MEKNMIMVEKSLQTVKKLQTFFIARRNFCLVAEGSTFQVSLRAMGGFIQCVVKPFALAMGSAMSFIGLSSAATRFETTFPHIVHL